MAKKVPIDGENYWANDEGCLELDTHFAGGHVDMWSPGRAFMT